MAELVKAGPTKTSKEDRKACADAVISHLASALPRGWQAQNAAHIYGRFRNALQRAREGIDLLGKAIENDRVSVQALGLRSSSLDTFTRGH